MKAFRSLRVVLSLLAMGLGGLVGLWSLVCLLGHPDGKFGELQSFMYAATRSLIRASPIFFSAQIFSSFGSRPVKAF